MVRNTVAPPVVKRLPKYLRYLKELVDKDIDYISSYELSKIIGFTSSQIRQDLHHFGIFGSNGSGYSVGKLYDEIKNILGLDRNYAAIIIGAGNIGQTMASSGEFGRHNFHIKGIFDVKKSLIGLRIRDTMVYDMAQIRPFIQKNHIDVAFICTDRGAAQSVADTLVDNGIQAIWNFAPVDLKVPENVVIDNVNLIENLFTMSYFLNDRSALPKIN